MILYFGIENFMSIKKKQELFFRVSKKDKINDSIRVAGDNIFCNTLTAVLGSNASGKTNLLKALSFLLWFSKNSYHYNEPIDSMVSPHALSNFDTSKFELIFEKEGVEFSYKLHLNNKKIEYEYLGARFCQRKTCLYEIKRSQNSLHLLKFNRKMGTLNPSDKDRFLNMYKTCSFFSFLLATGYLNKPFLKFDTLYAYKTNIGPVGKGTETSFQLVIKESKSLQKNEDRRRKIEKFLSECDFGFSGFSFQKGVLEKKHDDREEFDILTMRHKAKRKQFSLSLIQESNGTQKIIRLLDKAFDILERGGILISDELEDAIHPICVRKIIDMFKSVKKNPRNAQLLFTTHSPLLLEECTKSQIYLVEKNEDMETEVFCLDEVEGIRNCDNFCNKYLAGAYGGIPQGRWI